MDRFSKQQAVVGHYYLRVLQQSYCWSSHYEVMEVEGIRPPPEVVSKEM